MCLTSKRVLELGCGAKQYGEALGGRHVGIDLRVDLYSGDRPDLLADAQRLPLLDERMDLVFIVASLLIIPDTGAVFQEVRRVLRRGGCFLVFDYSWWVARRLGRMNPLHRHRFSTGRLQRRLRAAGFNPVAHRTCVPPAGPVWMRRLMRYALVRRAAYPVSNWVVVSGVKEP